MKIPRLPPCFREPLFWFGVALMAGLTLLGSWLLGWPGAISGWIVSGTYGARYLAIANKYADRVL